MDSLRRIHSLKTIRHYTVSICIFTQKSSNIRIRWSKYVQKFYNFCVEIRTTAVWLFVILSFDWVSQTPVARNNNEILRSLILLLLHFNESNFIFVQLNKWIYLYVYIVDIHLETESQYLNDNCMVSSRRQLRLITATTTIPNQKVNCYTHFLCTRYSREQKNDHELVGKSYEKRESECVNVNWLIEYKYILIWL